MGGGLFTEHDMFSAFLLGLAIGLLVAGFAVAGLLAHLVDRDRLAEPAVPSPAPLADDATERISPAPVIDLPRRARGTRSWTA
jgi:hypothetical protein